MRKSILQITVLMAPLTGCGPAWAPPNAPAVACPRISANEFDAAIKAGATSANAVISRSGMVAMKTGAGVKYCATYQSTLRPCLRPEDFVIRYTLANGEIVHVRVPAGRQYRFRVQAQPTTCEIVGDDRSG